MDNEETNIESNVILRLPPQPRCLALARLAAAALGNLAGLTLDRIDDLRLAVDEMVGFLMARSVGEGVVVVLFWSGPDNLTVEAFMESASNQERVEPLSGLSRAVIASLVDSLEVQLGGSMPLIRLRMQTGSRQAAVEGATERADLSCDHQTPTSSGRGTTPKEG